MCRAWIPGNHTDTPVQVLRGPEFSIQFASTAHKITRTHPLSPTSTLQTLTSCSLQPVGCSMPVERDVNEHYWFMGPPSGLGS